MVDATESFARVALVDEADGALLAIAGMGAAGAARLPPPRRARPAPHPLDVASLVRHAARDRGPAPVLVLTSRAVVVGASEPLFGYADARRRTAVVSTSRLRLGREPARAGARIANVVAHERGHLDGLRHCATPGCVMRPARSVEEIDARGVARCGRCPRRRPIGRALVLAAVVSVAFCGGMDRLARTLAPAPARPFARAAPAGAGCAALSFEGRVLDHAADERGAACVDCAERAAAILNALFLQPDAGRLDVRRDGADRVAVLHAGVVLARVVSPGAAAEPAPEDAVALARAWADEVDALLRGKGRAAQGCPACHLERPRDMQVARRRAGGSR